MSIFVPRQNSDLNTLFAQFSITKTWIDVYFDERKERLNDMRSNELPSLLSDTTRILVDTSINSNLENTKKFALEKSGSSFKYVPVAKTEKLAVLCHRNLGYPYRNSDLIELNKIKGDIKALIDQKISEVKEQKLYFEAIKNYLPELKPSSDFSLKQATDLQAKNEVMLQDIKLKLDLIVADMRKFNELPSYFHVTLPLQTQLSKVDAFLNEIHNFLDSPSRAMQLIPRDELLNLHLNKDGPVPMEIYRYLNDYYLIKVGYAELETVQYIDNDWNDLMQINSTSRMSLVDLITLILGSLGVSFSTLLTIIFTCCASKGRLTNEQKRQIMSMAAKDRAKRNTAQSASQRPLLTSTGAISKRPGPVKRMAPQVNKMQIQPQLNQTNFSTMPSAPPMTMSLPTPIQPVRPNPVSEISQILARMNTQSTQRREEIKLPVYNPIGYGKTKTKKNKGAEVPLWMEPSDSD
jgi:hypothetical protein